MSLQLHPRLGTNVFLQLLFSVGGILRLEGVALFNCLRDAQVFCCEDEGGGGGQMLLHTYVNGCGGMECNGMECRGIEWNAMNIFQPQTPCMKSWPN